MLIFIVARQQMALFRLTQRLSEFSDRTQSVLTERASHQFTLGEMADDMNELRMSLGIATKKYAVEDISEESERESAPDLKAALFQYLSALGNQQQRELHLQAYAEAIRLLPPALERFQLQIKSAQDGADSTDFIIFSTKDTIDIATVSLGEQSGTAVIESIAGTETRSYNNAPHLRDQIADYCKQQRAEIMSRVARAATLKQSVGKFFESPEVLAWKAQTGMRVSPPAFTKYHSVVYEIFNHARERAGVLTIDIRTGRLTVENLLTHTTFQQADASPAPLLAALLTLEHRSQKERSFAVLTQDIEALLTDQGWQQMLRQYQFSVQPMKSPEGTVSLHVTDSTQQEIAQIQLDPKSGIFSAIAGETAQRTPLYFVNLGEEERIGLTPSSSDSDDDQPFTVLLAGRNGSLVDTLILARIVPRERAIRLVSIPRDLRISATEKINDVYRYRGIDELLSTISHITGYQVHQYVMVEMMAFAEVINVLGGVEMTLDRPLIDPTYRVVNNGQEGTLYYPAGTYQLSGNEALRIVRSRATTSDFMRAERQRNLLRSLLQKAKAMEFYDLASLLKLARTLQTKVLTNIDINAAVTYFFRYKNFQIDAMAGLSSQNVLEPVAYISRQQCDLLKRDAAAAGTVTDCDQQPHAYMLRPRGGNWQGVQKYVRGVFE